MRAQQLAIQNRPNEIRERSISNRNHSHHAHIRYMNAYTIRLSFDKDTATMMIPYLDICDIMRT